MASSQPRARATSPEIGLGAVAGGAKGGYLAPLDEQGILWKLTVAREDSLGAKDEVTDDLIRALEVKKLGLYKCLGVALCLSKSLRAG